MLLLPVGHFASPVAAVASLLLDGVATPTCLACSFRKLRTAHAGPCVRVRRGSDNAEADFGFVNAMVDAAGILAFCGSGTGYISKWYDQSGNGNDIYNAVAANQTQICSGGTLYKVGSATALNCAPVNEAMAFAIPAATFSGLTSSTAIVAFQQSTDRQGWAQITSSGNLNHTPWNDGNAYEGYLSTSRPGFGPYGSTPGGATIHTAQNSGASLSVFKNGTQIGSAQGVTFTNSPSAARDDGAFGFVIIAELILSPAVLPAGQRQVIERSMGAYTGVSVA